MQKFAKNESGRTVLETLGVLVVIGLLTVSGIAGYSYLIQHQRRQETAKEVAQLVTSIRSSGIARRYAAAETIPAREAVKGPEMVDNGVIMKLPDGEESYAVVTTLNGGAFAVALQMQKGTCSTVLKALESQPVSMFEVKSSGTKLSAASLKQDNEAFVQGTASGKVAADRGATAAGGVRMNVVLDNMTGDKENERAAAKERLAVMTANCEETGRARVIFDCPGGSSGYSHVYGLYCNQCPQGMLQDANGDCCSSYACGNLCACPSGTMCDTEKNACVVCSTNGPSGQHGGNTQCWNVYHNEFARHVCDGDRNVCVECLTNLDCQSSVGPQNPYGTDGHGNYTHVYCSGHKCVECTVNYGETNGVACPVVGKPLCDNGACKPCPTGMVYDTESRKCVCATGVAHPTTGACVFCYDSARGTGVDVGCGSGEYTGKPICTDVAGTNSFGVGGTNNTGVTCYECVIDNNCNSNEYCDKTTHTCKACGEGRMWDGTACRLCQDNRSGEVTDNGCYNTLGHLCKPASGNGNGTGEYGDSCHVCRNNNYGNNQDNQDEGCNDNTKLCQAGDGEYGMECYKCRDDHKGAERDSGCSSTNPICLLSGAFDADRITNNYGSNCVVCVNDKNGYSTDTGCTADKPMCNGASGQSGTQCTACPAGQIWNDMLNNGCTVCYDSKTGATTDAGCGSGSWAGKPICVTPGKVNNGQGTSGNSCAVCINDKTEGIDTGCSENQPLCNGAQGEFGTACTACPSGQIWNGKICAVCFDTATGVSVDNGCGTGTWSGKPICVTPNKVNNGQGTAGNSCAVCQNDKTEGVDLGCSENQPLCNAAQGEFGTACTACPSGQIWNGKVCAVCFDTATGGSTDTGCGSGSWAGKPICGAKGWVNNGQGTAGDHCALCMNDKTGDAQDSGCSSDKPSCVAPQGQFGNTCEKPCSGSDQCIDAAGVSGTVNACIKVNSFDDIKRGSDGKCECLAAVRTQEIKDMGNSYSGKDIEAGYNCKRLITSRKRLYKIPVNFYCARYMHVSDDAEADDFVYSSSPTGIGSGETNNTHDSWGESSHNWIETRVSSGTIQKGTATLVVSDRWAAEVGLNGYFYFTTSKGANASGAQQKLKVSAHWNPGSSQNQDDGWYRCKSGAGSSSLPSKYKNHCSNYCD